jgi:hypothetical protein
MTLPILPAEINDLRIAPPARLAVRVRALCSGTSVENYSAATALAGKQLDWLQQEIVASSLSPALDLERFTVVVAGRNRVATVSLADRCITSRSISLRESLHSDGQEGDGQEAPQSPSGAAATTMRKLLDCCGTKPGHRRDIGDDLMQALDCAEALLMLLSPAEAAEIHTELERCRELGLKGCVIGLLGKNVLLGKNASTEKGKSSSSSSSLWPIFLRLRAQPRGALAAESPHIHPPRIGSPRIEPPRIQAVGAVPQQHADRVVANMLRWIAAEQRQRMKALKDTLGSEPDAKPQDQQRLADKFKQIGGPFFPLVVLGKSSRRGRYGIMILSIDGWNRDTQKIIFGSGEIPERPQLAASIIMVKGLGHHQYDVEARVELIVSHHALSRLVQRSANRTVDDLLAAVTSLFVAYMRAGLKIEESRRLRFPTVGGEVIAQLERHRDGSHKVVAKTILEIEDD